MGPPTGGMMEGLLVSNSPFLGDFLDPPLTLGDLDLKFSGKLQNNYPNTYAKKTGGDTPLVGARVNV